MNNSTERDVLLAAILRVIARTGCAPGLQQTCKEAHVTPNDARRMMDAMVEDGTLKACVVGSARTYTPFYLIDAFREAAQVALDSRLAAK